MTIRTTALIILALAAWFLYWMNYQADAQEISYEENCQVPAHATPWIVNNGDTLVIGSVSSDAGWTKLILYSATEEQYYQWPIPNGRYTLKGLKTWTLCWKWINTTTTTSTVDPTTTSTTEPELPAILTTDSVPATSTPALTLTVPYQTPQGLWTVKRPVNVSAF